MVIISIYLLLIITFIIKKIFSYCRVSSKYENNIFLFLSSIIEAALKQCRNIARQYSYFNKLFQNTQNPVSDILRDVFTYEEYW